MGYHHFLDDPHYSSYLCPLRLSYWCTDRLLVVYNPVHTVVVECILDIDSSPVAVDILLADCFWVVAVAVDKTLLVAAVNNSKDSDPFDRLAGYWCYHILHHIHRNHFHSTHLSSHCSDSLASLSLF